MDEGPPSRRSDWCRIAIVVLLALLVRSWVITHTEVAARDSIGYIRYALQFDDKPWAEVVRESEQHPAFPVALWLMSKPVRVVSGGVTCDAMVLSDQLANLFAAILMIVPIYFTGKTLFNRNAGFLAAALLQCLPVFVQVTADGLSEAFFLLFLSSGLYCAVSGLQRPAAWRFLLCGLFTGLAYLTRPEGLELLLATSLVLGVVGLRAWGWRQTALRSAVLALGVIPCVGLYVRATGRLTNKPTPRIVIGDQLERPAEPPLASAKNSATLLATFWSPELQAGHSRILWAGQTLAMESAKAFHYGGLGLVALGLVGFRRRLRESPGMWVLLTLAVLHAALLWRMAVVIGYLSERHALVFVLLGSFWAAAAILEIGRWLAAWPLLAQRRGLRWLPEALAALVLVSGAPELSKTLHANRAGHHAAGCWMAGHISARDEVIDPFCWAHFYAGCVFRERQPPLTEPHARYVVLEQSDNRHARLPLMAGPATWRRSANQFITGRNSDPRIRRWSSFTGLKPANRVDCQTTLCEHLQERCNRRRLVELPALRQNLIGARGHILVRPCRETYVPLRHRSSDCRRGREETRLPSPASGHP